MLPFFDLNKHDYNNPTETEEVYKAFCKIEDIIENDELLTKLFIDAKYKLEKEKKQFTLEELYNEFFRQINFTLNTVNIVVPCNVGNKNSKYLNLYPVREPKCERVFEYVRVYRLQKMLIDKYNLDSFTEEESKEIAEEYPYFFESIGGDSINTLGKLIKDYEWGWIIPDQFNIIISTKFLDNRELYDNYNHDVLRCESDEEAFDRIYDLYTQLLNKYNKKKKKYERIKFIIGIKLIGYSDDYTKFGSYLCKKYKKIYNILYNLFFK